VDQELVAYLDRRFAEPRSEVRAEIAASTTESRRHFDVVAERLMDKIQLVGEGVLGLDKQVDRVAAATHDGSGRVDRRFLHLQARLAPRRRK
jgi:hypothetical protein